MLFRALRGLRREANRCTALEDQRLIIAWRGETVIGDLLTATTRPLATHLAVALSISAPIGALATEGVVSSLRAR